MKNDDHKSVAAYVRAFDDALARLPSAERREIVSEIHAYLLDRSEHAALDDTFNLLGAPSELAAGYLQEDAVANRRRSAQILFRRAMICCFTAITLTALALAIFELVQPETTGVWFARTRDAVVISAPSAPSMVDAQDVLGSWALAVFASVAGIFGVSARFLMIKRDQ